MRRQEGPFFQILYEIHKLITLIFAGKIINFGNYCCLTKKDVITLSKQESLWSSFSGTIKKNIFQLNAINSTRGIRYFGPSKMSIFNLGIHSFSIIAVFKSQVFLRGLIFSLVTILLKNQLGSLIFYSLFCLLLIFLSMIYICSFRENIEDFLKAGDNVDNVKTYTH